MPLVLTSISTKNTNMNASTKKYIILTTDPISTRFIPRGEVEYHQGQAWFYDQNMFENGQWKYFARVETEDSIGWCIDSQAVEMLDRIFSFSSLYVHHTH